MLSEFGVVVELNGNLATVKIGRHEECTACGACASARDKTIVCDNKIGAKIKDRVKFEMPEENVIMGAFMVFIFPLAVAAAGAAFAYCCIPEYIIETSAIFFLISLIFVKMYDMRKMKDLNKTRIVEIL